MDNNILYISLYILLIALLLAAFFYIQKKRRQVKNETSSVVSFNKKIQEIVAKLETPEEKINALKYALQRVKENEEYDSNLAWKNGLMITIYMHMVVVYNELGDDDEIIEICDKILELNKKHALTYYNRGYIYHKKRENEKSLSDLQQYLALDKKNRCGLQEEANDLIALIERQG